MSTRFVVVSFVGLGWAFFELSGGADFAPPERAAPVVAVQETDDTAPPIPSVKTAAASNSKAVMPVAVTARAPALSAELSGQTVAQNGSAFGSTAGFDGRIPTGGLRLVSLEGGLVAITTKAALPVVESTAPPAAPEADVRFVRASRVNMRQGPGTNYSILNRLLAKDKVIILEDSGTGWLRLKVEKSGQVGWIAASLLTKKAP